MTQDTTTQVKKRRFQGVAVTDAKDKTVRVLVESIKMHKLYKKQYKRSHKYAVHDEKNQVQKGDTVVFEECRPLSKQKRWRVVSIVKA